MWRYPILNLVIPVNLYSQKSLALCFKLVYVCVCVCVCVSVYVKKFKTIAQKFITLLISITSFRNCKNS